jgi:hypothetical protein
VLCLLRKISFELARCNDSRKYKAAEDELRMEHLLGESEVDPYQQMVVG